MSAAPSSKRKRESEIESAALNDSAPENLAGDELAQFLEQISDFTPTIPSAVIEYHLLKSGFVTTDDRIIKMIALATQKFVADVAVDALQHCKQRQAGPQTAKKQASKDKRFVLRNGDLQFALKEHGVNISKPPYYV